ncbi:MAG: lanthionine synthetase C family protein [Dinghuibacter sp.]|nr:lanthionine synthetase C family protein [Dinghuibacter sp.]
MKNKWEILITDKEKVKDIEGQIQKIDGIINAHIANIDDAGLFSGFAGILLHKAAMWQYFKSEQYYNDCSNILNRIFDVIENRQREDNSYCSGIAGVGMVLRHLVKKELFDFDYKSVIDEFTPPIINTLELCIENNFLDFLYGATGLGIYLLDTDETGVYNHHVESIINHIEKVSVPGPDGRMLEQYEPYDPPFTGCNFGLAHGIPAILVFLSKASEKGIMKEHTAQLTAEIVDYLLSNRNTNPADISAFPNFITDHPSKQDRYSRLAWCYGDLGVCASLMLYAGTHNNKRVMDIASEVLVNASFRLNQDEPIPATDPFFCHGTAGMAHIFNRAYNITGAPQLKHAVNVWVQESFNYLNDNAFLETLKTNNDKADLLNGIAGTSLVLLSLITGENPDWDKFFLLS